MKNQVKCQTLYCEKDPSLTTEEVLNFAKENLTGYKRPRYVEFMDELPKSNVGKIYVKIYVSLRNDE